MSSFDPMGHANGGYAVRLVEQSVIGELKKKVLDYRARHGMPPAEVVLDLETAEALAQELFDKRQPIVEVSFCKWAPAESTEQALAELKRGAFVCGIPIEVAQ